MQISSRFTIAIHIFACIDTFEKDHKITSDLLASSIQVNPVIIRKILSSLKKDGLLNVQRGTGGASIAKPLDEITLLDLYKSVECIGNNELFHFHENPNPVCPVGKNIHTILDERLLRVQTVMEKELASITMKEVLEDTRYYVNQNR